jgi:signal peptidase I
MSETEETPQKNKLQKVTEVLRIKFQSAYPFFKRYSPWAWIAVILLLGLIYFFSNSSTLYGISPGLRYYLVFPLIWILAGLSAVWGWLGLQERPSFDRLMLQLGSGAGLMQVSALLIAGMIFGFGNSPYSHQFPAILGNLFYVITYVWGLEFARAYLLHHFGKKRPGLALTGISLLFTFLVIPLIVFARLNNADTIFASTGKVILPKLAESILATYLVMAGGPWASIIYRLIVALFEWSMPILPKLSWLTNAFVGTVIPAIMLIIINQTINKTNPSQEQEKRPETEKEKRSKRQTSIAWLVVAIIGMLLIWFNLGLFGVQPFLVSGVSMRPTLYAGDIVIIKTVEPEEVAVGDVILYQLSQGKVLHRVIEIQEENGQIQYITQGDGLSVIDDPVSETQLQGKMIASIPKIGWITIGIRRVLGWDQ